MTGVQFGIIFDTASNVGVMGVGFATAAAGTTFLDQIFSQGLINSRSYSLYLNDIDAQSGSILFGGVDTEKFTGTLSTFPMNRNETGTASAFIITLTGLSISLPNGPTIGLGSSNFYPMNVVLDVVPTLMVLPESITLALADAVGATYSVNSSLYVLPDCSKRSAKGALNFFFSGVKISVPYDQLIVTTTLDSGAEVCILGVMPAISNYMVFTLGDPFLRAAYVVFDLVRSNP
jgi:Eukaryotic aspartyl protease